MSYKHDCAKNACPPTGHNIDEQAINEVYAERDLLKAEVDRLKADKRDYDEAVKNRWDACEDRDRYRTLCEGLAEAERCEVCPDQGWYGEEHGGCDPDGENDTRESVQVECEFCKTNPKSRYNAIAAYDAQKEPK